MQVNSLLSGHDRIGWDIDETLLGHPASAAMLEFIETHPRLKHFLITFRSHGYEKAARIEHDFRRSFGRPIDMQMFSQTLSVGNHQYVRFQQAIDARSRGGPYEVSAITDYVQWKGMVCSRHGITVLVDDNTDHVLPGCHRYEVQHIHPDDFL